MKFATPEIAWHNKDPVYSIDIQQSRDGITRLASCGTDKDVRIWSILKKSDKAPQVEFLSTLSRHQKAVNVVRFSPDGSMLASGGDDCCVIIWKMGDLSSTPVFDEEEEYCKEKWNVIKVFRNHLEDILDISWSADGQKLVSGSVDNTAIVWDVQKGSKLSLCTVHRSFVQGVAFDPLDKFVATMSCDRSLRIFQLSNNALQEVQKLQWKSKSCRIFHDDSMKSFFRRLSFSPDGMLLVVPSGCLEAADEGATDIISTTFIFSRENLSKPIAYLPLPPSCKTSLAVRFCPKLFKLWNVPKEGGNTLLPQMFQLPYRMVFAVVTDNSLVLYDTQFTSPIAYLSDIHYHTLSDISWSADGSLLVVSSTDGYCTLIGFEQGELGEPYGGECVMDANAREEAVVESNHLTPVKIIETNVDCNKSTVQSNADILPAQEVVCPVGLKRTSPGVTQKSEPKKPRRVAVVTLCVD